MKGARVKSVYGKPWSRMVRQSVPIDAQVIDRLGQIIVDAIVLEAKKDLARQRQMSQAGAPVGLPDSQRFFESFGYRISGKSTVEVTCSWPFINQLLDGRKPFPMSWLTQVRGVGVVPLPIKPGLVIFRMAPPNLTHAWIHPGFAKHGFIQRGVKKGREAAAKLVASEAVQYLMSGDPLL